MHCGGEVGTGTQGIPVEDSGTGTLEQQSTVRTRKRSLCGDAATDARGRKSRFATVVQHLACDIFDRTAVLRRGWCVPTACRTLTQSAKVLKI